MRSDLLWLQWVSVWQFFHVKWSYTDDNGVSWEKLVCDDDYNGYPCEVIFNDYSLFSCEVAYSDYSGWSDP